MHTQYDYIYITLHESTVYFNVKGFNPTTMIHFLYFDYEGR